MRIYIIDIISLNFTICLMLDLTNTKYSYK